jgi:hypothetical protein
MVIPHCSHPIGQSPSLDRVEFIASVINFSVAALTWPASLLPPSMARIAAAPTIPLSTSIAGFSGRNQGEAAAQGAAPEPGLPPRLICKAAV